MNDKIKKLTLEKIVGKSNFLEKNDIFLFKTDDEYNKFKKKYMVLCNQIHKLLCKYFQTEIDKGYAYSVVNKLLLLSVNYVKDLIAEKAIDFIELGDEKYLIMYTNSQFFSSFPVGTFSKENAII